MWDGSAIVSILGLGAIGLGFLLAFLGYRLLKDPRSDNKPIYAFLVFCFALVLVGALLQYSGTAQRIENLQSQVEALKTELSTAKNSSISQMQALQTELNSAKNSSTSQMQALQTELNSAKNSSISQIQALQTELNSAKVQEAKLATAYKIMITIKDMVPDSIKDLEGVNAILTGNSCSGGSSGVPLWGNRGTIGAAQSTKVMRNLSAAKSAIEGILPQK